MFTLIQRGTIVTPVLIVHAVFAAIIVILLPSLAHAWGPGMHVETAMTALSQAALAAPVVCELIRRFPEAFIYGAASPDIVLVKRYAGYLHHCHNWRIGWMILKEAKNDRQRAAAWGYLMHLAADIVSHNYYIPFKIMRSFDTRLLTHSYWEMRFDLGIADEAWERLEKVSEFEIEEFDEILEQVLNRTLFSFSTNKRIFNTILILQNMRGLRRSLKLYAKHSRFEIGEENRQHYVDLTHEAALGFLADPQNAPCLQVDPAGLAKLDYAKKIRSRIRSLLRNKKLSRPRAEEFVELVKERLAVGLYRPEMTLPKVEDVL